MTVELYCQDPDTSASSSSSSSSSFVLDKRVTPGNLQGLDEFLFFDADMADTPVVMAIKVVSADGQKVLGVAFADASLRVLEVSQFSDDDKFSNLRSVISQRGAKECVLPTALKSSTEGQRIQSMLADANIPVQFESKFNSPNVEQDLKRLVGSIQQLFDLLDNKYAVQSLGVLINYLDLLRDDSGFGRFKLRGFDLSQFVKLDTAAIEALNLFPQASDANKNMNLFGLLNKGKTAAGARLLKQWLKQPLVDVAKIQRRLNYVELMVQDTTLRQSLLEDQLRGAPDLERVSRKFVSGKARLEDLVSLYKFIVRLPSIVASLMDHDGVHKAMLQSEIADSLERIVGDFKQLEALVETTVDLDALDRHEYLVNPAFNSDMQRIQDEKQEVIHEMEMIQQTTMNDLGLDDGKDRVKLQRNAAGYCLRVTRKDEKFLRGKARYHTIETRKDGVRFTTSSLRSLARRYEELCGDYDTIQSEIVRKCTQVVATYAGVMEETNSLIAELDVYAGLALVAINAPTPYVRPVIYPMGHGILSLRASRHPCLEVQDNVSFIPNDVELKQGESNLQVITGPNMGGKSTYIRQVGVCVLMAQIGCFVPCDEAEISVVDCIRARVGAGDSQLRGVSTFMKEMLEASAILRASTKNSLLIIDELGRGTSTYDGFGLAWAIAEHISAKLGGFTMFATHFHELTSLADQADGVVNRHVTAHTTENSITMLYRVNDGPCDRSFGIHVSELANFPAAVVRMAKRKAYELEDFGAHAAAVDSKESGGGGGAAVAVSSASPSKKIKLGTTESRHLTAPLQLDPERVEKMTSFLTKFSAIPAEELTSDELRQQLVDLGEQ
jgi:DNA mismatch repair protein MSH2